MKILIDGQTLATPDINRGIGAVFKQVSERLIESDISKEWFVSVHHLDDLRHFSAKVRSRLSPVVVGKVDNVLKYGEILQQTIDKEKINIYWNPNPLMTNVMLPMELQRILFFVTVYDLIPWIMKNEYFEKWPEVIQAEYKKRLFFLAEHVDQLIFISESARNDFLSFYPSASDKAVVVALGVDHSKFYSLGISKVIAVKKEPYILFVGGFDARKNNEKAIEAFAKLVQGNPLEFNNLKFFIVCECSSENKRAFQVLAEKFGVGDRVELTGYVSQQQLLALYQNASIFLFPSLYEGFGLPVLEAMAVGLPVVCSNTSSLPEVGGDQVFYCNPENVFDISKMLAIGLKEIKAKKISKNAIQRRARQFDWNQTVAAYSTLFNRGAKSKQQVNRLAGLKQLKVAYVSPWIPQRTGIADYSYQLVSCLKNQINLTLFVENPIASKDYFNLSIKHLSSLPNYFDQFDAVIYHVGNNSTFHREIYKMAWNYPGILVLHDYVIHPFLAQSFLGTDEEIYYELALQEGYADQGANLYQKMVKDKRQCDIHLFPLSCALVQRSRATIVHSAWVKNQFSNADRVVVVPHGSSPIIKELIDDKTRQPIYRKLGVLPNEFLISTFGFINYCKRIPTVLRAISCLVNKGYPIKLLLGGEIVDDSLDVNRMIKELDLENTVKITGYLTDLEFEQYLSISDIVLNLRYPSMGETSGTLMKALRYGKPCIVSNYCQFSEFPDAVCWKVDVDENEIKQLVAYLEELMRNPKARTQLGLNAKQYMEHYATYDLASELYCNVISSVL